MHACIASEDDPISTDSIFSESGESELKRTWVSPIRSNIVDRATPRRLVAADLRNQMDVGTLVTRHAARKEGLQSSHYARRRRCHNRDFPSAHSMRARIRHRPRQL